jgi:hypothetical protein
MKFKYLLYIIIGLLIILNISLNFRIRNYKEEIIDKTYLRDFQDGTIKILKSVIAVFYQGSFTKHNKDSILLNNSELKKHLMTGSKVICYMQKTVCQACIFKILQDLAIMEETIGNGHVIVATNIGTKDHPFEIQEFSFPTIYVKTFYFPEEFSKEAIVFVLDKQLNIKLFFLPEMFPQLRQKYFNEILPSYFESPNGPL